MHKYKQLQEKTLPLDGCIIETYYAKKLELEWALELLTK